MPHKKFDVVAGSSLIPLKTLNGPNILTSFISLVSEAVGFVVKTKTKSIVVEKTKDLLQIWFEQFKKK